MAFPTMDPLSWKFVGQPYDLNSVLTPDQVWAKLDLSPEEVRAFLNTHIGKVNSATDSASGADNTGMTPIAAIDATASTIQSIVEAFVTRLQATADGLSGADFVALTAIDGVAGTKLQPFLEAFKVYVDGLDTAQTGALSAHKSSTDHDGRYYTEAESDAKYETITDLTTTRKLSATGDFTGTLNGAPITATDPGLSSTVEALKGTGAAEEKTNLSEFNAYKAETVTKDYIFTIPEPDGVTDNTLELIGYFALGHKHYVFSKGIYLIDSALIATSIGLFTDVDGITIDASQCLIIETNQSYFVGSNPKPIFKFSGCKNVKVILHYDGYEIDEANVDVHQYGLIGVNCVNECNNVDVLIIGKNLSYGLKCGEYGSDSAQYLQNGNDNIKCVVISDDYIGYPLACYGSRGIEVHTDVKTVHRQLYFNGCSDVEGTYMAMDLVGPADTFCPLSGGYNVDGEFVGCHNYNVKGVIKDSTILSLACSAFELKLNTAPTSFKNLDFNVDIECVNGVTSVQAFRLISTNGNEIGSVFENIKVGGLVDYTGQIAWVGTTAPLTLGNNVNFLTAKVSIEDLIIKSNFETQPINIYTLTTIKNLLASNTDIDLLLASRCDAENATFLELKQSDTSDFRSKNCKFASARLSSSVAPITLDSFESAITYKKQVKSRIVTLTGGVAINCFLIPKNSVLIGIKVELTEGITGTTGFKMQTSGGEITYNTLYVNAGQKRLMESINTVSPVYIKADGYLQIVPYDATFTAGKAKVSCVYETYS